MGFDDREMFDDDLGPSKVILAGIAITVACLLLVFIILALSWTNARAQAGVRGPVPNVVGSQYLDTPNAVADKQLVPIRVLPDGTVVVSTGGGSSGGTVQPIAGATGGATPYFLQPTASTNAAVIKAGAGTVYNIIATNNSVTTNYLRLYNATTGFNGCNSATNLVTQVAILPSGGISTSIPVGMAFSTGISICVTSGYATTDTTAATASAMSVTVVYN